jgi:branched-chain amino acid transport system ATP-binding protein
MRSAIDVIEDEHRSIAAVLHGLLWVTGEAAAGRLRPDARLLEAMVQYVEAFPERLHHPKEDAHLFPALRRRAPGIGPALDALEAEHVQGRALLAGLSRALAAWRAEGDAALPALAQAVRGYAAFHWAHMQREEEEILPLAARTLGAADWAAIDAAFAENADPLSGVDARRELRELFRRITALAPPPVGVGPEGDVS